MDDDSENENLKNYFYVKLLKGKWMYSKSEFNSILEIDNFRLSEKRRVEEIHKYS